MTTRSLLAASIIALLSLGSSAAWAQEESTPAPPQTQVEHFQDWEVHCGAEAAGSETHCEMLQTVNRKGSDQPIMRIAIGYPPQTSGPVAIFVLPLGMRLPPGVQFKVDSGNAVRFPVQLCVTQGCRADLPLKDDMVRQLRAGHQATVTIHEPRGEPLDLPISLMGFTAALERISP